tara:strand:+ start:27075 stop:27941 length:867 start_codon:yes stop_codon:yes gene_type:complete
MEKIPIEDFKLKTTDQKKNFFTKDTLLKEWDLLKGGQKIKLQRGSKGKPLDYTIYGWEPAIILKFKYLSKNRARVKDKEKFWDSVIWHGNQKLSDTDILDPSKYNFNTPFRILTEEESKTAGQNKIVRDIEAGMKNKEACKEQLKQAKKRQCGKFRSWNKDKVCETPQCTKKERHAFQTGKPNIATEEEGKDAAATAIQSVARGRSVRNKGKSKPPEKGRCVGEKPNCKKLASQNHSGVCMSYGCKWEGPRSGKKQKGGRKKKKRRKAFPSRRKNNRKNRTKKKALSK